jgi:hypothetical protein
VVEVTAAVAAGSHRDVAAEQHRGDEPPAGGRFGIDLLADQPPQHEGALRVADQHHAAAVVEALEVRAPRLDHVGVTLLAHLVRDRPGVEKGLDRELPVDRGEDAAVARVARGLIERDGAQHVVHDLGRLRPLLVAHGRIDVEAVRPPALRTLHALDAEALARGREDRRREAVVARTRPLSGLAEPDDLGVGRRRDQQGGEHCDEGRGERRAEAHRRILGHRSGRPS